MGPVSEGKATAVRPSSMTSPSVSIPCDTVTGVIVSPARTTGCSDSMAVVLTKAFSGCDRSMKSGHTRPLNMSVWRKSRHSREASTSTQSGPGS